MPSQSTSISATQTYAAPYHRFGQYTDLVISLLVRACSYLVEISPVAIDGNFLSTLIAIDRIGCIRHRCASLYSSALQSSGGNRRASSEIASWRAAVWLVELEPSTICASPVPNNAKRAKGIEGM